MAPWTDVRNRNYPVIVDTPSTGPLVLVADFRENPTAQQITPMVNNVTPAGEVTPVEPASRITRIPLSAPVISDNSRFFQRQNTTADSYKSKYLIKIVKSQSKINMGLIIIHGTTRSLPAHDEEIKHYITM